jgi:hypothetical protein
MKNIDPKATTVKKALCPFCSFGCEFGVVFDDFGISGVEYISKGSSGGRLCPRGSAASMYLDHPRRLSTPMKKRAPSEWAKIVRELKKVVDSPKSVAVTFDRNITQEEYASIVGFCKSAGIEDISSTYFEPEANLKPFMPKTFSMAEIEDAQTVLVLGDPFNQAPMSSRAIIDWRLKDKSHELIVVDSINTHTAGFASRFLRVKVGTEPLLFFALAQEKTGGADVAKATGIETSIVNEVSKVIKGAKKGLIFVCLPFAHTYDPALYAEGIARLQSFSGMKVVPFVEFIGHDGNQNFGSIIDKVKKKKTKYLLNFGELFPFYYPQVIGDLRALNIYATSTLKYDGYNMIPVPLNLEKEGSIATTFGKKSLSGSIEPPSGTKSIRDILGLLSGAAGKGDALKLPERKLDVAERMRRLAEVSTTKKKSFRLIGEKVAYNFLGLLEGETLKIHPQDAAGLGITANDLATVTSKHGSVDLPVKLTEDVNAGIVAVQAETPSVKGLFEYQIDSGDNTINFIPTEVKICRKE